MNIQNHPLFRRHPVAWYYLLALAFTWLIQIPLVAVKQGWLNWNIPFAIHYLASFGPMLAALIMTGVLSGQAGLKELWSRVTRWRVGLPWTLFCLFSPAVMFAISLPIVRLVKGDWPDLRLLGQANYLPPLGFGVVFLWLVTYGFGEEIGWRGFALPRLQARMSVSKATLLLALLWAFWHMPAFFYLDTFEELGLLVLPGFLVGVLFGAVLLTWIYNSTRGSILMVAVWHSFFDLFSASKAGQDIIPIIMSAVVIVVAFLITNLDRPWNFHHTVKQTLSL